MKVILTDNELKKWIKLSVDDNGFWKYEINTDKGKVIAENFEKKENAIIHASKNLVIILKSVIKQKQ